MTRRPPPTPSQTIGPFFGIGLPYDGGCDLVPPWHPRALRLTGRVLDGAGDPVTDALVEIWQADPAGRPPAAEPAGALRRDPLGPRTPAATGPQAGFSGFGRCATGRDGRYHFITLKPGPRGTSAPCLAMLVFARGLLKPVRTRVYFAEDAAAHAADPLLAVVEPERRGTMIAVPEGGAHRFDVRLQGPEETVFLAH